MASRNTDLVYRPLRPGCSIYNPQVGRVGTLAFIGQDAAGLAYAVSCYHVLCRLDFSPIVTAEPIYQPDVGDEFSIGDVDLARIDADMDCAAARLDPSIGAVNEILGIGVICLPTVAAVGVGLRVIKCGVLTGITEGEVVAADANKIEIRAPNDYPSDYDICGRGDSGALWVTRDTHQPVGMHFEGSTRGLDIAYAVPIDLVLQKLSLTLRLP